MKPFTFIGPYIIFGRRTPLVRDIQRTVASHFRLPVIEMTSARRAREVARPRQIAMFLCREYTRRSLPEIGRRFGGRDHTTVMHAIHQVARLNATNPEFAEDLAKIRQAVEAPL